MDRNVSTTLSSNNMGFTINWLNFESVENEINAKKFKVEGKGKLPKCSTAKTTYMVNVNNVWERCVKTADKLRRIAGATVKDETKMSRFDARLARKYNKDLSADERKSSIKVSKNNNIKIKRKDDKEVI